MADSKISALPAVTVPAGTDELAVNQSGTSKKITATQILSLVPAVDLTGIAAGNAAAPSLAWGDGDSGFYELSDGIINFTSQGVGQFSFRTGAILPFETNGAALLNEAATSTNPTLAPSAADLDTGIGWASADILSLIAGGVEGLRVTEAEGGINVAIAGDTTVTGIITVSDAAGGVLRDEAATSTNPTFMPNKTDIDTGIGWAAADQLSLISKGLEIARFTGTSSTIRQTNVAPAGTIGTSNQPTLAFGTTGDTGIYETGADNLGFTLGTALTWTMSASVFASNTGGGPKMMDEVGSVTNPTFVPNGNDTDSGLGGDGADAVTLVAGGVEGLRLSEASSGVLQAPQAQLAVTANAGGGQESALQLTSSYVVVGTCATAGDSIKLPASFAVHTIVYIKNDGAESCDVFPNGSDDLGQGADTAEAVAAGTSAAYIATVANTTWTPLLAAASSGGDVSKVGTPTNDQVGIWTGDGTIEGSNGLKYTTGTGLSVANGGIIIQTGGGNFRFATTSAPALMNESASGTNPTVLPAATDVDTGLGLPTLDVLSLIAGGKQIAQCKEVAGAEQFIVSPGFIENNAALPALAFGDGDTGFYELNDDTLGVSTAGVGGFFFQSGTFGGQDGNSGALFNQAVGYTTPSLLARQSDINTGIGSGDTDSISLVAGGVEAIRLTEVSTHVIQSHDLHSQLTADVGSAQGSGLLVSSYTQFTTVGTTGDSTTLPATFIIGTVMHVINDGANSMDVFPASGDDAGAGTDTAVAVAAGARAKFVGVTANALWATMYNA